MIRCPNCTAQLEFDASLQQVHCEYCGSTFNPKELEVEVKKSKEVPSTETYEGKSYSCSQCGATLLTFDETAITFCSYCGSQAMIESKLIKNTNPQFIIPFKKTQEECVEAYKTKIKKSLFTPNYMKSDVVVSKFRGIYIPYCIYKLSFHDYSTNKGEKYSHRRGDYVYYDQYDIKAKIDADYDGISYDMVSNLYDNFTHAIPHNYKEAEPFNVNYLAGYYADTSDVENSIYEDNAITIANIDVKDKLLKQREFTRYNCHNPKVDFQVSTKTTGLFPLYFLAIRDKKEQYVNYAVVNGQTGKIVVDLPVDFKKYILFSLLLTIPIFFILDLSIVIVPTTVTIFSIICAIISLILSIVQMKQMYNRQTHADDEGYMFVNKDNKTKQSKIKFRYIIKQIIGIILGFSVILSEAAADIYYYGAAIFILCLVIWSFYDLVKEHNLLVSTKLPQLEKRGGSENE